MLWRRLKRDWRKIRRETGIGTARALLRYPRVLRQRARYRKMLALGDYGERFGAIYAQGLWHSAESGSGQGSEVAYTEALRTWLPRIVARYGIETLVDAPCGDFNWMRLVLPELGVRYHGIDIVAPVIAQNRARYAADGVAFDVADICADALPDGDLLMVRDCLFHLSYRDIDRFFRNIARVNYRYLLTTTNTVGAEFENSDITTGDFRRIALFKPPFSVAPTAVLDRVDDYPEGYPIAREMILLRKADVPERLGPIPGP